MRFYLFASLTCLALVNFARADEPAKEPVKADPPKAIKSTFLITGMHCPPCTSTVERSLKSLKGVQTVKVDWNTKNAKVEFDEQQITAQQIAGRIGSTSHMMGRSMTYGGWLALRVPDVEDVGKAAKAKEALLKVKGVSDVAVYSKQKSVGIAFDGKANLTSAQLIETLKEGGFEASLFE